VDDIALKTSQQSPGTFFKASLQKQALLYRRNKKPFDAFASWHFRTNAPQKALKAGELTSPASSLSKKTFKNMDDFGIPSQAPFPALRTRLMEVLK
jgi:hypothetical protein